MIHDPIHLVYAAIAGVVVPVILLGIVFAYVIITKWDDLLKEDVSRLRGLKGLPAIARHEIAWKSTAHSMPKVWVFTVPLAVVLYAAVVGLWAIFTL